MRQIDLHKSDLEGDRVSRCIAFAGSVVSAAAPDQGFVEKDICVKTATLPSSPTYLRFEFWFSRERKSAQRREPA
jgi:hypothetical protein